MWESYTTAHLTRGYTWRIDASKPAGLQFCRSRFLTEGSTPRRGRRVLPVTLGRHHKQTQTLWVGADRAWPPCPRSGRSRSTRCGAQSAVGRAKRRVDQNRRTIHDSQHQRVQTCSEPPERARNLEWIRVLRTVSCVAREDTCPTGIESSSRRVDDRLQNAILAFRPRPWYKLHYPLV